MSNRPVEQALGTLLPTHADDLPSELVQLATSLVAQSRSFSSSLKPEEEIARPYACAEIACKRLSRALKLPPLLGHPPCPPRVYKKLYGYLDKSLTSNTVSIRGPSGTPTKRQTALSTTTTPSKTINRTPSKTASSTPRSVSKTTAKEATPSQKVQNEHPSLTRKSSTSNRPVVSNSLSKLTQITDAASWVMPSVRTVCKILSTPAPRTNSWSRPPISRTLPPHIFVGVSSVLHYIKELKRTGQIKTIEPDLAEFLEPIHLAADNEISQDDDDYKEMVLALIVAVYFLVLARRRTPPSSTGTTGTDVNGGSLSRSASAESGANAGSDDNRQLDKKTFTEMRSTALSSLGLPPTEKRHGEDVDTWIALIMELNWAKGKEWFENVPLAGEEDEFSRQHFHEDGHVIADFRDEDDSETSNPVGPSKRQKTGSSLIDPGDRGGLLPGLGTMMQDRVDWLSEDRREDFREWKDDILKRIQKMEQKKK